MTALVTAMAVVLQGCPSIISNVVGSSESIQRAVDRAESGETVKIMGTHDEDVAIGEDGVTLAGRDGAVIQGDVTVKADRVTIENIEISGKLDTPTGSFANLSLADVNLYGTSLDMTLSCSAVVNRGESLQRTVDAPGVSDGDTICLAPGTPVQGTRTDKSLTFIRIGGEEISIRKPGEQQWAFSTGYSVNTSPGIGSDGTIYVGSGDDHLYALTPEGKQKWRFAIGNSLSSSPAIGTNGTIYVATESGQLVAINPNGTEKWRFSTGGEFYASPAIGADGTVYCGSSDGQLYAINPDGTEKWNFDTGGGIQSPPVIGPNGTIYVGTLVKRDNELYAVNPDGSEKWSFSGGGFYLSSPAIDADGTIYAGAADNLYALNPDGSVQWQVTSTFRPSSPVIGTSGTIYVGSHDGSLYAINPDGTRKWRVSMGYDVAALGPAVSTRGTIYVSLRGQRDTTGSLVAVRPDGSEKWRFDVEGNMDWDSAPTIGADGTLYVGSSKLYAIFTESSGLADTPWPMFRHDARHSGRAGAP